MKKLKHHLAFPLQAAPTSLNKNNKHKEILVRTAKGAVLSPSLFGSIVTYMRYAPFPLSSAPQWHMEILTKESLNSRKQWWFLWKLFWLSPSSPPPTPLDFQSHWKEFSTCPAPLKKKKRKRKIAVACLYINSEPSLNLSKIVVNYFTVIFFVHFPH